MTNFKDLMKVHILSARKVVEGKVNNDPELSKKGLQGLKENTSNWGAAIGKLTGDKRKGKIFQKRWDEHVKLEGDYIGQIFKCKCESIDFGECRNAKSAKKILTQLKNNGKKIIGFLDGEFGDKGGKWKKRWVEHLQCVKDFIDLGKEVQCKKKPKKMFIDSVHHCIKLGNKFGAALNAIA